MKEEERADWRCQILLMRKEMSLSQVWTPPPLSLPIPPVMCVDVRSKPGAGSVRFPAVHL